VSKIGAESGRIMVKSHVARDLLQNAALFKTDKQVVWEYVSNGLEYVDPGTKPEVRVRIDSKHKRIVIKDNGRGMSWADLQNFFVMHGENVDRKKGRPGRGRFGTGKSAAFGIADVLRITTVRNGRRSKVELHRSDIQLMSSGDPVPVREIEREVQTTEPNGTIVEIESVHLKKLDRAGIIRYIERQIARWPRNIRVFVDNHKCEFNEPPIAWEKRFRPSGTLKEKLGDVELIIKVAKAPLEKDLQGISIYSKGVWYETTLAGSEGREMSQYIFGELDVPRLDEDKSPIPPFDLSRSMQLNPSNELVQAIYAFIGQRVEEVRRELVRAEKERRRSEEARKLAKQAEEIARLLNEDFKAFRQHVARTKAKVQGALDLGRYELGGNIGESDLVFGKEIPAQIVSETGGPGSTEGNSCNGVEPRTLEPEVALDPRSDEKRGRWVGGAGPKYKPYGGFQVTFQHMGVEERRAKYIRDERTIYINLDHPQLSTALAMGGIEEQTFRRLAYEVACSEYAIALAQELEDIYVELSDALFDIRETIDRLSRRGADMFSKPF